MSLIERTNFAFEGEARDGERLDPPILRERVERYYRDRLQVEWNGIHPMRGRTPGAKSIQLRTNDYLCLAGDARVIEAEVQALRAYGHGDSISRIWIHHEADILRAFERRVAGLMGAEDAVLCNSGYCANVGLIQSIADPGTPIYLDMKAHMSLWEGIKSAAARPIAFRHNDPEHLEKKISRTGPGFVVVDALYSTDGDVCPLADIIDVAERYNCPVIVDETHSFGTHGRDGAGMVSALGLEGRVQFRTVGLSKAVGSRGGIIVCSNRNAEFFRYEALPAIFSTSVLQHEVAGYDAVLDIFKSDPWRRERLHRNHRRLKRALDGLGYNVDDCRSQILSLEAGEVLRTVQLRDALEVRGVFGSLFFAPAVPKHRCLIRFTLNCGLTDEQVDQVIDVCRDIREEVRLSEWASTRRKRGASLPMADASVHAGRHGSEAVLRGH